MDLLMQLRVFLMIGTGVLVMRCNNAPIQKYKVVEPRAAERAIPENALEIRN